MENYFNYFTEIEEHFWKKRGAHLLVSPLDWAIMETWQKAGVPLEIALKGIDRAFESYQRSKRGAGKPLKSLAYCTDAVLDAAEEHQEAAAGSQHAPSAFADAPRRAQPGREIRVDHGPDRTDAVAVEKGDRLGIEEVRITGSGERRGVQFPAQPGSDQEA